MAVKKDLICFIKQEKNIPKNKAYKWKKFIGSFDWKVGSQYDHGFIYKFALLHGLSYLFINYVLDHQFICIEKIQHCRLYMNILFLFYGFESIMCTKGKTFWQLESRNFDI